MEEILESAIYFNTNFDPVYFDLISSRANSVNTVCELTQRDGTLEGLSPICVNVSRAICSFFEATHLISFYFIILRQEPLF
jgi:hypothetical protein